jgi:regulator of sirC expression with transglutaminase-like and TPR domain
VGLIPELWSDLDARSEDLIRRAAEEGDLLSMLMAIEGLSPEVGLELARQVAELAVQVRVRVDGGERARDALVGVLVTGWGLRGDVDSYFAIDNSLISKVLARRRGQPILVSAIWILVGRAADLDVVGVGLPGHFVVGVEGAIVDPFFDGRYLSFEQCKELAARANPGRPFEPSWLAPVTTRQLGERVLRNLQRSLREAGDMDGVYRSTRLIAAVQPDANNLLELAQLAEELGVWAEALSLYRRIVRESSHRREGQIAELKAVELESRSRVLN